MAFDGVIKAIVGGGGEKRTHYLRHCSTPLVIKTANGEEGSRSSPPTTRTNEWCRILSAVQQRTRGLPRDVRPVAS